LATVDIAIINWNTSRQAVEAARAFARSEGVEVQVRVLDNASTPEQRRDLKAAQEFATVIESGENLGFGRAANLALAEGDSKYVLVSNADVIPEPTAVTGLVQAFQSRPRSGLVGVVLEGTSAYHDRLPGPVTLLIRTLLGGFNRKAVLPPERGMMIEVGQPAGACFLTSREVWKEVGGFDEGFFLWYEDVDLAKRVSDLGYENLITGDARVRHTGGESLSSIDPDVADRIRVSSLHLYAMKHHPATARVIRWISPSSLGIRKVFRRISFLPFDKRRKNRE